MYQMMKLLFRSVVPMLARPQKMELFRHPFELHLVRVDAVSRAGLPPAKHIALPTLRCNLDREQISCQP